MLKFAVGVACGAAAIAALSMAGNRTVPGAVEYQVDTDRGVAFVLIGADHFRRIEREVDERTGRLGFSHVVVDAGELDPQGRRLVYDCFPREGVRRVVLSERYGSERGKMRPRVRVSLPERAVEHARGAMNALVGTPYDLASAVAPSRPGLVCSRLVMRGLPEDLAERVRPMSDRHPISPNDLARAFGVAGPYSPDVVLT